MFENLFEQTFLAVKSKHIVDNHAFKKPFVVNNK